MSTHNHDIDYKTAFTVEPKDHSQVTITGELPFEEVAKEKEAALKKLGANVELDGFRKGHVPADVLEKHVGEQTVLSEMAERALAHHYAHIVTEHDLDVIGHPQVQITKLAKDNPFAFSLTVAVVPEITLSDYQAIAKEVNKDKESPEVTEEDVEKQVEDIMRRKMAYERLQTKAAADEKNEATEATDLPTPESEAAKQEDEAFDPETAPLPELNDEYVKELGQPGQFETVDDFKAKVREHLEIEKEKEVTSNHRAKITDKIVEESTMTLPKILIDAELNQMFAQMEEELSRSNLKMEDYLTHIKKSREDLETEWSPAAEKRAKLQLILNEIAKAEDIKPDEKQLEEQVKQLMEQYKDADETRVKVYVASVLQNEAVMQMLEQQ